VHLFVYNLYNIIRNIDLLRQYTSIKYGTSSVGGCYSPPLPQTPTHASLVDDDGVFEEDLMIAPSEAKKKSMRALP
jgi:hypothetical protein